MANIVTLYIPILPKPLLIDFPVAVGEDIVAMDSNRIPVFKKAIHKIEASWNDVRKHRSIEGTIKRTSQQNHAVA